MTDKLREAAQIALEALNSFVEISDFTPAVAVHAISTLQNALMSGTDGAEKPAKKVPLETLYETIIQWDEGGGKRSRRELARRIAALYILEETK